MVLVRERPPVPLNGQQPGHLHNAAELTLDLPGTPDDVASAVVAAAERGGGTVEHVEPISPPGSGYRIMAQLPDAADLGPLLLVFDLAGMPGAGGGTGMTRVRIVQSGFGTPSDWDDAFAAQRPRRPLAAP